MSVCVGNRIGSVGARVIVASDRARARDRDRDGNRDRDRGNGLGASSSHIRRATLSTCRFRSIVTATDLVPVFGGINLINTRRW